MKVLPSSTRAEGTRTPPCRWVGSADSVGADLPLVAWFGEGRITGVKPGGVPGWKGSKSCIRRLQYAALTE